MSFYHVYSATPGDDESGLLQLRYETSVLPAAQQAAAILFSGRALPARLSLAVTAVMRPGIVTGVPVWVRNKTGQHVVVMITEHPSAAAAAEASAKIVRASRELVRATARA